MLRQIRPVENVRDAQHIVLGRDSLRKLHATQDALAAQVRPILGGRSRLANVQIPI